MGLFIKPTRPRNPSCNAPSSTAGILGRQTLKSDGSIESIEGCYVRILRQDDIIARDSTQTDLWRAGGGLHSPARRRQAGTSCSGWSTAPRILPLSGAMGTSAIT